MNFNFRLADDNDLSDIMELMNQTRDTICPKEWFVEDTEDSVRHILAGNGFIILAMPQHSEEMAGFFIIKFPGLSEENLGNGLIFQMINFFYPPIWNPPQSIRLFEVIICRHRWQQKPKSFWSKCLIVTFLPRFILTTITV